MTKCNDSFCGERNSDWGLRGHIAKWAARHPSTRISSASCWNSSFYIRALPSSPPSTWDIPGCCRSSYPVLTQWEHTYPNPSRGLWKILQFFFNYYYSFLPRLTLSFVKNSRNEQIATESLLALSQRRARLYQSLGNVSVRKQLAVNRSRAQGKWQPSGCSRFLLPPFGLCQNKNNT